jgi:hypothetical protein
MDMKEHIFKLFNQNHQFFQIKVLKIYDNDDSEYIFSSNDINIEEKEDLNENKTKEETIEEK